MYLSMTEVNHSYEIERLLGRENQQKQLMNLGLVPGARVRVVSTIQNNMIVLVKDTRLGIGRDLAQKILVRQIAEADAIPACAPAETPERSYS